MRIDRAGQPDPRDPGDRRRDLGDTTQDGVDGDGIGIEVEQGSHPRHQGRQVTEVRDPHDQVEAGAAAGRVGDRSPCAEPPGASRQVHDPRVRRDHAVVADTDLLETWQGVERVPVEQPWASKGARAGRCTCRPPSEVGATRRRARSSVGVTAKTSRTVSLNCRTLANPAAKATSAIGRSDEVSRVRAVCARCARLRAFGPAPSSSVMIRLRWRSE